MALKYISMSQDVKFTLSTNIQILVVYYEVTLLHYSLIFKDPLKARIYSFFSLKVIR